MESGGPGSSAERAAADVEHARRLAEFQDDDFAQLIQGMSIDVSGYELTRPLAVGGQGLLYLANRVADGSTVVIKVLRPNAFRTANDQLRFDRESQVLRQLDHPRIVHLIHSGFTQSGLRFHVMKYVPGECLNPGKLSREMPLKKRLELFVRICRVVTAAHQANIVHRDLKPSNIQIDKQGEPWLLDFGIAMTTTKAQLERSLQMTGRFAGTPLWSSFEQLRGETELTPASDVFSLGIILHQMLTGGRFPASVLELIHVAVEQEEIGDRPVPRRRSRQEYEIRPDLAGIISKCLSYEPRDRYQSAHELADAVEKRIDARTLSRRGRRWVAFAAALIGCSAATWYWIDSRTIPKPIRSYINAGRVPFKIESLDMIYIPPGKFTMGLSDETRSLPTSRQREAEVTRGFYLGAIEVSQELYQQIMGVNPSRFVQSSNPVERVSYDDAVEFCRRLSARTGRSVRLPTEIEWEYACRSGTRTQYFFGDDPKMMIEFGNIADLSNKTDPFPGREAWDDGHPHTSPGGSFLPNAFGLCDMHGNVWEWCQGPYRVDPNDPTTVIADRAPSRGGSWWDESGATRSGHRSGLQLNTRTSTLGFRIACDE